MKKVNIIIVLLLLTASSCKKFTEVDAPYTSFNGQNVYTDNATAIAAVTDIYTNMSNGAVSTSQIPSLSFFCGLSADELTLNSGVVTPLLVGHYTNNLSATAAPVLWTNSYSAIYVANASISGLTASTSLTPAVKQQLLGECYFIRAFCYFYLTNLYGDVPLVTTPDYKTNGLMARTPANQVWTQVIADLHRAQTLLSPTYVDATLQNASTERVRPIKWTATSLLARADLYTGNWQGADSAATAVIGSNSYSLSPLSGTSRLFTKNCAEAIWQLQPVMTGWNTQDARVFVLPSTGPTTSTYPVYLSPRLVSAFETGDLRFTNWVQSVKVGTTTYYYPAKYQSATLNAPVTEYNTVLRLGEQYLIRAEARTQNGNLTGALQDLNVIRQRAGLVPSTASTTAALSTAILQEKRIELFTEYGARWLDLKRTQTVNIVMGVETTLKGGNWNPIAQYFPISTTELVNNPSLTQTPGY